MSGIKRKKIDMKRFGSQTRARKLLDVSYQHYRFDHGRFGLKPEHRVLSAHVTINDDLPNRIISGSLVIKPNIGSFSSEGVIFEDCTEAPKVDTVIFATGYSFGFPLVENGQLIPVKENHVDLYKYMFPPQLSPKNSLAVIGLVQPTGSIMPISEMQTRVFIAALNGKITLPSRKEMELDVKLKHKTVSKEFTASRRHTIQVYYVEIMDELAKLLGCQPSVLGRSLCDPLLAKALLFHGLVPYQYRLQCIQGPHKWPGARNAILTSEDRVFNATRTRITKETQCSKPPIKIFNVLRLFH
uniref:Flavin-containing monooxygenase n=1 Tax=Angiostrongylus cantonensis TaxID=6313 RepID=A0A0K0D260_ANGCA